MAGYGRATAEALATLGQALKTQSDAVDHGTHFNSGDIPADWDPNFGQFVPCPKSLKPVRGVIAYLRQLAGDKNPSTAGLIKATASSTWGGDDPHNHPDRVLDWVDYKYWKPGLLSDCAPWVQIDFLDKRVIVKEYVVYAWGRNREKLKGWALDARNSEDEPWENIDTEPRQRFAPDGPLDLHDGPVLFSTTQPDKMYRYLRFCRMYRGPGREAWLPAVEFFGALVILKDPPVDGTEPGTAS